MLVYLDPASFQQLYFAVFDADAAGCSVLSFLCIPFGIVVCSVRAFQPVSFLPGGATKMPWILAVVCPCLPVIHADIAKSVSVGFLQERPFFLVFRFFG